MGKIRDYIENSREVYTESVAVDIDVEPKSTTPVNMSAMLQGTISLSNTIQSIGFSTTLYTGNGTSQDIVTRISSVDFTVASNGSGYYHDRVAGDCIVKNDAGTIIESGSCVVNTSKVHIKSRSLTQNHGTYDGLRGIYRGVSTDTTSAEYNSTSTLTAFNSGGVTVSTNAVVNQSGTTYILHQTLYTHIKWGLTSQGKRYLTAYNPVTREVMTMYQGSGLAGHQIPNPLGIKLDYWETKPLNATGGWLAQTPTSYGYLHLTNAFTDNTLIDSYDDYLEVNSDGANNGYTNLSTSVYISYGFANSETKIITQYTGTGASGNFVETKDVNGVARKPRRVIIKRTDGTGNWLVWDTERDAPTNDSISLNLSNEEGYTYESINFNINGFDCNDVSSWVNALGGQYIAIVEFDTTGSNDDTYFDLPTDTTQAQITDGVASISNGFNTTSGVDNKIVSVSGTLIPTNNWQGE